MTQNRRSDHDVTDRIRTTDPVAVAGEVQRLFQEVYQGVPSPMLARGFEDVARLFRGEYPGYLACDTGYHNLQHTLEVALAMARLMSGYELSRLGKQTLQGPLFEVGVLTALLHDCGYIRGESETSRRNGAEYTLTHVSRGAGFLRHYLERVGKPEWATLAEALIHFTGYEVPVEKIGIDDPVHRLLGNLLGSADIVAQMADRCYLEKVRELLYPEFVLGGIARRRRPDGSFEIVFSSADDLVFKTPGFYDGALRRLNDHLGGVYVLLEKSMGGQNLYLEQVDRNIEYARVVADEGSTSLLRRKLPDSEAGEEEIAAPKIAERR